MKRSVLALAILSIALLASVASASPARCTQHGAPRRRSASIGYPWSGRLENAVQLRESASIRYAGEYRASEHFWGTWQLVQLLERAADRVARRMRGGKLSVGEMSARRGGSLPGHRSHENGRDADLSFYMTDARGRPYDPFAFATFGADGVGRGPNRMLRFDDDRNWELVARLVADGDARVQHIFVSNAIKQRLLRTGRRRNAPRVVLDRAAQAMVQPTSGHPHDNHFHVRIYCAPIDRARCRDRAPFYAWYPGVRPSQDRSELLGAAPAEP
jgi:penicillin-insensitive murein DD-endopeptidase